MRILALSHLYPHVKERRYGIFVARQLTAMAEAGAEITLLVPQPRIPKLLCTILGKTNEPASALIDYPGVSATAIPYFAAPGKWFWRWAGLAAYRAVRGHALARHAEQPFELIYSTQLILGGDASCRLAKDLQIPAANLAIGSDVNVISKQSSGMQSHYQRIVTRLDGTLACGQSLADQIDSMRPSPPHLKSLCVYGVVDLDYFYPTQDPHEPFRSELSLPADGPMILYVGYLRREKGLFELLKAFKGVRDQQSDVTLVLCGAGEDEHALKELASELGLADAIRFVGMVEPEEVRDYMWASDLFVLPSYNEGMPNAVMEAMSCGLPVVCTSVGGLTAALSSSNGAKLVPAQQVEPLQSAMSEILTNDDLHVSMSRAARATAEEQFDVRRSARRILDYLSQIIAHAGGAK